MDEFDRNLATWQAAGITRYAFTWKPMCFCDTTPRLVVADGAALRIDGIPAGPEPWIPAGVPGLFEIVRRAINGDSASVDYDATTGVPVSMTSDPVANGVDDELSFAIDDWTLEPPDDRFLGDVSRARAIWNAKGIESYSMTLKANHEVYEVAVRNDQLSVTQGGRKLPMNLLEDVYSVRALFDGLVVDATQGHLSTLAFDDELGYPTEIITVADRRSGTKAATVRVTNFRRR